MHNVYSKSKNHVRDKVYWNNMISNFLQISRKTSGEYGKAANAISPKKRKSKKYNIYYNI